MFLGRVCAYPLCDELFLPPRVTTKYCPHHRGKHSGRNARRAAKRLSGRNGDQTVSPEIAEPPRSARPAVTSLQERSGELASIDSSTEDFGEIRRRASCMICGDLFTPNSSRTKYCPAHREDNYYRHPWREAMRLQFPGTGEQASENAARWAEEMTKPAVAVVLDTETTALNGVVIEVAVIDAANGSILLDTLVNPGDEPVDPLAASVHGISPAELAAAPAWADVIPQLLDATRGRRILAWKAEFDAGALIRTCERFNADPLHLAAPYRWGCVMECDRVWRKMRRPLGLYGDHRALADCREIRHQLFYIANEETRLYVEYGWGPDGPTIED